MRKKFLVESKTMCTGAKQFGLQEVKALDFEELIYFICRNYGHFWAKMAQVHKIYSVGRNCSWHLPQNKM